MAFKLWKSVHWLSSYVASTLRHTYITDIRWKIHKWIFARCNTHSSRISKWNRNEKYKNIQTDSHVWNLVFTRPCRLDPQQTSERCLLCPRLAPLPPPVAVLPEIYSIIVEVGNFWLFCCVLTPSYRVLVAMWTSSENLTTNIESARPIVFHYSGLLKEAHSTFAVRGYWFPLPNYAPGYVGGALEPVFPHICSKSCVIGFVSVA